MSTTEISLTDKQQFWLNHINEAKAAGLSLADYAQREDLSLQSMYSYVNTLRKKGVLEQQKPSGFTRVVPASASTYSPLRIYLNNGVRIDVAAEQINVAELLNAASQL